MLKLIRKFRILPMLLVVVIVCLVLAHPALAVEPTSSSLGASMNKLGITAFAGFFSTIIILIALLSIIIAILLGDLMTSFYIFDTGMGDTLHLVWEIMRNFVNVVFIIALLIIAVRVIFGIGDGGGTSFLKKILPKFIIALIAVNLTFFGARFVIGTADVLATAVFALPKSVVGEKMIRGVPCPDTYKEFQTSRVWEAGKCSEEVQKILMSGASGKKVTEKEVSEFGNMIKNVSNATGVNVKIQELVTKENFALVLLMNILRLDDLLWLKSVGGSWQTFLVGGLGSIIMAGAVGVVYFMLFVAFLIRVVILWIMIPLMPLGVLAMVMKDVIPGMPEAGGGTFSLKGFINTAFMPVFVAFPLSIGMIMIFGNNSISTLDGVSIVSLDAFTKHFNVILWWAASIGVIWVGTKEAIKLGNEYAAKFTDSIHSKVNGAVGAVAGTAKYLPIIPSFGKGGGTVTADSILQQPHIFQEKLRSASSNQANEIAAKHGYGLSNQAMKVKEFGETTSREKQKELINDGETRNGLMSANASPEVIKSRQAFFANADIHLSDDQKKKLGSLDEFKKLINNADNAHKINSWYGPGVAESMQNTSTATPATTPPATTPAVKTFNGISYDFNGITNNIKTETKHDDKVVTEAANKIKEAAKGFTAEDKKDWVKLVDEKFGKFDAKIQEQLKAAMK